MTHPTLLSERSQGVLTLILNRPDKLNAINNDLAFHLLEALRAAAADPSVSVVRIRGNGRAFCAGRDVSSPPTDKDLELVQAVSKSIVECPKPVVAAVHGWTVGAGFEWMMNADLVFAAEDARFKLPEASLGVFVTGGLVATLPATVGLHRAKAIALLGEAFGASQAVAWGLAFAAPAPVHLEAVSMAACVRLAGLQPDVIAQFKRVLNLFGLEHFEAAMQEESRVQRSFDRAAS